jgi:hypothetical protein
MNLPDYIRQIGAKEFAKKFGVSERAAIAYRQRTRLPKPEIAERIVAGSPVTWEGIYAPDPKPTGSAALQAS